MGLETLDEPQQILHSCRKDMTQLWNSDQGIKDILRWKKIKAIKFEGSRVKHLH